MHHHILGDVGLYYEDADECYDVMSRFEKQEDKDWNRYRAYTPANVMHIFQSLLDEIHLRRRRGVEEKHEAVVQVAKDFEST